MLSSVLSWTVDLFGLIPIGLAGLIIFRKLKPKPERELLKKDWRKDVVYLCGFPFVPSVRTISPFALKLEAWLRLTGIEYENVLTRRFSSKGQIPYIELNGKEIADSNIIIATLKTHFNVDPDKELDETAKALGHTVSVMVENHTAHTGFHYRYGYNMEAFISRLEVGKHYHNENAIRGWKAVQPYMTRFRNYLQGLGRHDNEVVWEFARQDLKSISALLGTKQWLLGGAQPSTVDCLLFGHLAQFLYIDIGFPQKTCLEEECTNLVDLVNRIKERYFSDWESVSPESNKSIMLP